MKLLLIRKIYNSKGQLLIEIVLSLLFLVIILNLLFFYTYFLLKSQRYNKLNNTLVLSGFEKYRNILISLAQNDFNLLDSLTSTEIYHFIETSTTWLIATGSENVLIGDDVYKFYFQIGNYTTNTIKFVTTTVEYFDLIFKDYFLLPKLNTSY